MRKRYWFKEADTSFVQVNFIWQQSTRGLFYERLNMTKDFKQVVNHYEFHREISTKINLIKNLQYYCEVLLFNVFLNH